jgi:hypothetical protein
MSESTADRFIRVMAKLRAIDPSNDEPMRHHMRTIRDTAEALIEVALAQAERLAWAANDGAKSHKEAVEDALEAHIKATQGGKEGAS